MFTFRMRPVLATVLMLSAGSDAIADENEVSVEVEATNAAGYELEVKVEGTSLGFIDRTDDFPESFFGDLGGEATLTDPSGNECEVEIVGSNNGIGLPPTIGRFISRLALINGSGAIVVSINHNNSMSVVIPPQNKFEFVGCDVGPAGQRIVFPGELAKIEIEKD